MQKVTTSGRDVLDNRGRVIERHKTPEAALRSANRLNRICVVCGHPMDAHAATCSIRHLERDPNFGSEYDDSEEEL